ncbi:MAG TPA: YraN family protein [Anaerolineales bacterium]|nr:YraN family protein [Anaerolineae bacterium]HIQ01645.1 YraN family protein [Anaerolineales bacterium]
MIQSRVGLGRRGENLAARELTRQGYEIVARNWRCEAGEVDIVVRKDGVWHFVEVRTRRGERFGTPEESLTPAKQARMVAVAEHYLAEHELGEVDWRLDLVAVEMDPGGRLMRVEMLENVVEGPL